MSYTLFDADVARQIAATLLDIEAIRLNTKNPYTWASGWKSPIYCDNRLTLSYPEIRSFIKNNLIEAITRHFPQVEVIAGVATAGVPQGAIVAEHMNLPFNYVRSSPKGHGLENLIEGKTLKGRQVVVVEDLVSTGSSSLNAVAALREAGYKIAGMVAIFTYGFNAADERFEKERTPLVCLSNYAALLEEALKKKYIKEDQLILLKSWRTDPAGWKGK